MKGWRCAVTIESCANQMFVHLRCCPTFLACRPFSSFLLLDILTWSIIPPNFVKFLSFSLSNPLSFSHISISLYYRSFVYGFSQVDYESWKTGNPTPSGHAGTISWEWSSKEVNEWSFQSWLRPGIPWLLAMISLFISLRPELWDSAVSPHASPREAGTGWLC